MLNSLYIKNFRNLEELTIESLGRVNLITGKNNTGKSSVLEAVALWVADGSLPLLSTIIKSRGEFFNSIDNQLSVEEAGVKTLSSIFTNRRVEFSDENAIKIGENPSSFLVYKFKKYGYRDVVDEKDKVHRQIYYYDDDDDDGDELSEQNVLSYNIGIEVSKKGHFSYSQPLSKQMLQAHEVRLHDSPHFHFIPSRNVDESINSTLFDNIILTEKEQHVIDALKIIEPKTQRIAFVQENGNRKAVIKLSDNPEVLPLQSMGDGINRILTIILALVNCEKGYLLIDEFENGLHHTVQEQLWRVIFYLVEKLDIQVFATTHSWDCIEAYENVLNDEEIKTDGKLIRLEHKNDKIRAVAYRKSQLKSATDFGIEVR